MPPEQPDYFSDWQAKRYTCRCGWQGSGTDLSIDLYVHATLIEASCPKCDCHLAIVQGPTEDEIKAAASAGNDEAKGMLPGLQRRKEARDRFDREKLRHASELPDVVGERLEFVIDIEGKTEDSYYVITVGEQVLWREPAGWEDWERFDELKKLLKRKYGARFENLTPTSGAENNLLGDNIRASLDPS